MKLEFQASFDVGDLGGFDILVTETGGNTFAVQIESGEFFLTEDGSAASGDFADLVASIEPFLAAVETQLNDGTADAGAGYEVSWDNANKRVFFFLDGSSYTGVTIEPRENGGLLGLTETLAIPVTSGSGSALSQRTPDHWIDADAGFWSDWSGEYEGGDDVAYDVEAHDGRPGGAAKEDAAIYLDFRVPLEPVAKVGNYPRLIETSAPWTWAHFWRHCRNTQAFTMRDDDEVYYLLMRAEGAMFRPRALGDNYIARWDLDFQTRVLARGS